LQLSKTHAKTFHSCLRVIFLLCLFITPLLINSCAVPQKSSRQQEEFTYKKTGIASYYGSKFQSRKTASGEIFNNNLKTAAHRTLPFGTQVIVTNLHNHKSVKVRINDRGPYVKNRIIDLTRAAFSKIESLEKGITKVGIMVVD